MSSSITTPQWCWNRTAIYTFASFTKCKIHWTVVRWCTLKAWIVRSPCAHHHILCVKLRRKWVVRREIVRLPAILCGCCMSKCCTSRILSMLQWTIRWHINGRIWTWRLMVMMITRYVSNACCHIGICSWWMKHFFFSKNQWRERQNRNTNFGFRFFSALVYQIGSIFSTISTISQNIKFNLCSQN